MSVVTNIGALLAANALKLGLVLALLLVACGGGYVMGDAHASRIAVEAAAKAGDARAAALQKNYAATIQAYLGKVSAENARGKALSAALAAANAALSVQTAKAQEAIVHAVPPNSACDLSVAAADVLRRQPARQ